jgi:hypothetical protein
MVEKEDQESERKLFRYVEKMLNKLNSKTKFDKIVYTGMQVFASVFFGKLLRFNIVFVEMLSLSWIHK